MREDLKFGLRGFWTIAALKRRFLKLKKCNNLCTCQSYIYEKVLLGHAEHETDIQQSTSTWTANKYASSTTDSTSTLNLFFFLRVERRASRQRSDSRLTVSHKLYRQTTLQLLDTDSVLLGTGGQQQSHANCWWNKIPSFPHDRKQMGVT